MLTSSYYTLALTSFNDKKYKQALTSILLYLKLHPLHLSSLLLKAKIYFFLRNFTNSFITYDKCLSIDPRSTDALSGKAYCLKELKYYNEAVEIYTRLNTPPQAKLYNSIGTCYYGMGKKEDAICMYNKAIALNPNYTEAFYNKGVCLSNLNKKTEAINEYDRAIQLNQNYIEAYFQ